MEFELMLEFDRMTYRLRAGVEVGILRHGLGIPPCGGIVHTDNAEMAIRLADAMAVSAQADDSDGDWLWVTYC